MINKIFEEFKNKNKNAMQNTISFLDIDIDGEIKDISPKKNTDILVMFSKLGLLKGEKDYLKIIDEYHDDLFKWGIELGVVLGKRMLIEECRKDQDNYNTLMDVNPKEYVDFKPMPAVLDKYVRSVINE